MNTNTHLKAHYFNTPRPEYYWYEMNGERICHDDYWADFYNFNKKYLSGYDRDTSKKNYQLEYKYYCKCGGKFVKNQRFKHVATKKHRNFFNE